MFRKIWGEEEGQTIVLLAVCMAVLLGFVALATDAGVMFHTSREAQLAADSAAIAGAQQLQYGNVTAAAQADAALNGFTNGKDGVTVQVNDPPLSGPRAGKAGYVEVIVKKQQPTFFMRIFGVNSMSVPARAVATSMTTNQCNLATAPTGTGMTFTGTVNIQSPGCTYYANSNSSSGLKIAGTATVNAAGEDVVGGYSTDGTPNLTNQPKTTALPMPDPLASLQPPSVSNCQSAPHTSPLDPGCYNGLSITNGTVSLNPGTYIINGALKISGQANLTGSGVTFYLTSNGSVSVTGQATMDLSAPTSGYYNGILFYQDRSNSTDANFAGGDGTILQGILYFPDALVDWVGGSTSGQTDPPTAMSIISSRMKFAGNTTTENYADVNSNTPLQKPVLVE